MSYENRKREYERLKSLGREPPENLKEEFEVKENGRTSDPISINPRNTGLKESKSKQRSNRSKRVSNSNNK